MVANRPAREKRRTTDDRDPTPRMETILPFEIAR
jgi:hypothetical protein